MRTIRNISALAALFWLVGLLINPSPLRLAAFTLTACAVIGYTVMMRREGQ